MKITGILQQFMKIVCKSMHIHEMQWKSTNIYIKRTPNDANADTDSNDCDSNDADDENNDVDDSDCIADNEHTH